MDTPNVTLPLPHFLVGLDLGQAQDYTAAVVVRVTRPPGSADQDAIPATFDVVDARRWLGVSYPSVVGMVADLMARPELRPSGHHRPRGGDSYEFVQAERPSLVVDASGVGRAITDMVVADAAIEAAADVAAVTITGGYEVHRDSWGGGTHAPHFKVPKRDLVGAVQSALQGGRLRIASGLELGPTLRRELGDFKVKITKSAHEIYEARESTHDDLVLSLALALWAADKAVSTVAHWEPDPWVDVRW